MKRIKEGELHVVIAERGDQLVGVIYTRKPCEQVSLLASLTHVGRVEIRPSPYAKRIVEAIGRKFETSITCRSTESFWTSADFEDLVASLDEWDAPTGAQVENAGVKLHAPVYVQTLGRGVVTGFTRFGRVVVRMDRPDNLAAAVAIAPRSQVKPVLRVVGAAA